MARKKSTLKKPETKLDQADKAQRLAELHRAKTNCNDDILNLRALGRDYLNHPLDNSDYFREEFDYLLACAKFTTAKIKKINADAEKGNYPEEQDIQLIQVVLNAEKEIMKVLLRQRG